MTSPKYLYRGIRTNQYEEGEWLPINTAQVGAEPLFDVARFDMHEFGESRKNADLDHHMAVANDSNGKIRRRVSTSSNRDVAVQFATDSGRRGGVLLVISVEHCNQNDLTLQESNMQMGEAAESLGYPTQEEVLIDNNGAPIPIGIVIRAEKLNASGEVVETIEHGDDSQLP